MRKKGIVYITVGLSLIALLAAVFGGMFLLSYEKEYGEYPLLSTPIGELRFTQRWEKYMQTEELPGDGGYAVRICAKIAKETVPLYELYIGAETGSGFSVGYVNDLEIRVDMPDAEPGSGWSKKNIDILYSIQEDLNGITDQIVAMDGFRVDGISSDSAEQLYGDDVLLRTPIGELRFTEQWKDRVTVSEPEVETGYCAEIFAETGSEAVLLYALYIGTEEQTGTRIGYVNGTEVRIGEPEFTPGSDWTDEDLNTVYSIQEELHSLTAQIMDMAGFTTELSGSANEENDGEYVLLSTPLGELHFPQKWQDVVLTEEHETEEGYAAIISVQTASGTVQLYGIYMGTESGVGFCLGTVNGTAVWLDVPDVGLGDGWTDADIDTVYTVQEELDGIADQITAMDGFASE